MKKLIKYIEIIGIVILCVVMLASCTTYKYNKDMPFATHNRIGKYPTKKNLPVKHRATWTFRQWAHEGR